MFMRFLKSSMVGWCLLVLGCSDDVKQVGDNSDGAKTYDVSDITGTWDVMGSVSAEGRSVTGTLTIGPDIFSLELGSVGVRYSPDFSPVLQIRPGNGQVKNYEVTHEAGTELDLGVIPLRIGGSWDAVEMGYGEECRAYTERGIFGACQPREGAGLYGGFSATPVDSVSSIFGKLGGTWNVQNFWGMTGGCTAILRDTTFIARCVGTGEGGDGQITFTMQDGFGTGSSDEGLEVSAVRR